MRRLIGLLLAALLPLAATPGVQAAEPSPLATGALPAAATSRLGTLGTPRIMLPAPPTAIQDCTPRIDDISALPLIEHHKLPDDQFGHPGEPVVRRLDPAKVRTDLPALELAARSYTETARPGTPVLRADLGWQVLEHAEGKHLAAAAGGTQVDIARSGFRAVSYVNPATRRIVIAIAGTTISDRGDLRSDLTALVKDRLPEQFAIALDYASSVRRRFGETHSVSCTGHSLGGGACAYTAVTLGLHAVTFNPIASILPHKICRHHAARVDNYVVANDMAFAAYQRAGRRLIGSIYRIDAPLRDFFVGYGEVRSLRIDRLLARSIGWVLRFQAHKLDAGLDRLAQASGVRRPLRAPTLLPQVNYAPATVTPSAIPVQLGTSGLCWTGQRAIACAQAGAR